MRKLIKFINILSVFVFIGVAQQACADVKASSSVSNETSFQKQILYYVNQYRVKHHLSALKMSNTISTEAAKHSRDMASKAMPFGHTGYNGRIKRLYRRFSQCNGGAENVAYYKADAKKLVDAWIASPGHRQNIVGNYNLTGIGIAYGKKGWGYYTQIFLRSDGHRVV